MRGNLSITNSKSCRAMNDLTPIKLMIVEAGGEFFGIQKNFGPGGDLVLFNDPQNKDAGLCMYEKDMVSVEAIKRHIELKRREFKVA
jgi:hypothetical protein